MPHCSEWKSGIAEGADERVKGISSGPEKSDKLLGSEEPDSLEAAKLNLVAQIDRKTIGSGRIVSTELPGDAGSPLPETEINPILYKEETLAGCITSKF